MLLNMINLFSPSFRDFTFRCPNDECCEILKCQIWKTMFSSVCLFVLFFVSMLLHRKRSNAIFWCALNANIPKINRDLSIEPMLS